MVYPSPANQEPENECSYSNFALLRIHNGNADADESQNYACELEMVSSRHERISSLSAQLWH